MKNRYSLEIDAPPQRVFAWLGDSERALQWVPNLVESEDLAVTENKIGSTFRHVYLERGRRMEMQGAVIAYERDRRFACELRGEMFDLTVNYALEDLGGRTRLTQESETRFRGLPMKVLGGAVDSAHAGCGATKLGRHLLEAQAVGRRSGRATGEAVRA